MFRTSNGKVSLVKLAMILLRAVVMEVAIATLETTERGTVLQTMRTFGFRGQIESFFKSVDLAFDHVHADGPNHATLVQPHFEGLRFRVGHDSQRLFGIASGGDATAGGDGAPRRRLAAGDRTLCAGHDAAARWKCRGGNGRGGGSGGSTVVGGRAGERLPTETDGGLASEDGVGEFGFDEVEGTEELAEIVEEVAMTTKHASPVVRVFVVEEKVSRRTVVEPLGDFLEEVKVVRLRHQEGVEVSE